MLKDTLRLIEHLYKNKTNVSCIVITLIVLTLDYTTGKQIEFPILYALPIGMAALQERKTTAYLLAILLPYIRVGFHLLWQETQLLPIIGINAFINMLALIFCAYVIERIAWQTKALKKEIRTLEGILPICASCKKIQNKNGDYEQIESYIAEHSEASFTHGLCPECAKKLYPEYFKDMKG